MFKAAERALTPKTRSSLCLNECGFSMVELTIALTVVLVLAAVTFPSIVTTMGLYRLETSASMIEGKLAEARINAIKRNRQVWLLLDSTANSAKLQYIDGETKPLGTEEFLGTGIQFVSPTPGQITFDAQGWLTGSPPLEVKLEVENSGDQKTLEVSATGKITIS